MQDSDVEDSTFQLVVDQLEELVVTIIEELRERPGIVLAVVAGVVGAMIGSRLAGRKRAPAARAAQSSVKSAGDAADLARVGVRLLQNPLVRALIVATLERQFRRRFAA
ncbi:MAG: hypothetical protein JOZ87_23660 [Chloroflexi bacterium]|nr:hypothetical protein [Chloroflexota bacterium]